jgi:diaminopimelate epimerase
MLKFYKYHGAGNDFILINAIKEKIQLSNESVAFLCNRHMGIGADGLMLLLPSEKHDFEMKYYNSDGKEGSMCGNGGRCIVSFAYDMGIQKEEYCFWASDGKHHAKILQIENNEKTIDLQMIDVDKVISKDDHTEIDTGSPHHLNFVEDAKMINVFEEGRKIRYSSDFKEEGINVNFIEEQENKLFVRTYERGVENETLACGTGVTASAIASSIRQNLKYNTFNIQTPGGKLKVEFEIKSPTQFTNIRLTGPATFVFKGEIELPC